MSRLAPVERPPSLLGWIMSFAQRRMLGKTISPSKVVYNRLPRMWNLSWALVNLELRGYTIDEELSLLIALLADVDVDTLEGAGQALDRVHGELRSLPAEALGDVKRKQERFVVVGEPRFARERDPALFDALRSAGVGAVSGPHRSGQYARPVLALVRAVASPVADPGLDAAAVDRHCEMATRNAWLDERARSLVGGYRVVWMLPKER